MAEVDLVAGLRHRVLLYFGRSRSQTVYTLDRGEARRLLALGREDLEDLEALGLALTCGPVGVTFRADGTMVVDLGATTMAKDVRAVFDYWREVMAHPRAKLTGDRRRRVEARLREGYTVEDMRAAVRGCKANPFNQGDNPARRRYDDLELICRSGSKLEGFQGADRPQKAPRGNGAKVPAHVARLLTEDDNDDGIDL